MLHTDTPITLPEHQTQSSSIQGRLPDKDRPMENAFHRTSVLKCLLQFLRNNMSQILILFSQVLTIRKPLYIFKLIYQSLNLLR